jgi:hypothetical protein
MLSDTDILTIAKQMNIDKHIHGCHYKDELLKMKFKPNMSYIINLEDTDFSGFGSHYTLLTSMTNKRTNKLEYFYFDSTSGSPPQEVLLFTKQPYIPFNVKMIQSPRTNESCGYFCLAMIYTMHQFPYTFGEIYADATVFLEMFEDLNNKQDDLRNEFILQQFFNEKTNVEKKYVNHID